MKIPGYIGKQIIRTNQNRLLINGASLAIVLVVVVLSRHTVFNALHGPQEIGAHELLDLHDSPSPNYNWVRLRFDGVLVTNGHGELTDYRTHYYLVQVADRILLVEAIDPLPSDGVDGLLEPFSGEINERILVRPDLIEHGKLIPFFIDQQNPRSSTIILATLFVPLGIASLWQTVAAIRRLRNPFTDPLARYLTRWGAPDEIALAVESERRTRLRRIGNVDLTQSWLMRETFRKTELLFLGDVVWAYRQDQIRKTFKGDASKWFAVVYDRFGNVMRLNMPAAQVDVFLDDLQQRVPWMIIGNDPSTARTWRKDRALLLQSVAEREAAHRAAHMPESLAPE